MTSPDTVSGTHTQPEGSNASRQSLSYWADSTPSPSNDP